MIFRSASTHEQRLQQLGRGLVMQWAFIEMTAAAIFLKKIVGIHSKQFELDRLANSANITSTATSHTVFCGVRASYTMLQICSANVIGQRSGGRTDKLVRLLAMLIRSRPDR